VIPIKYPLFKVNTNTQASLENVKKVFDSGYINEGQQVLELQKHLEKFLDTSNLVLTNSGTSAITLALKICGVGPGDQVLTTAMTCIATNTPIINLGAQPVWVDIDAITGSMSPTDLEKKINNKTKAVLIVDWAGTPCNLDEIVSICKKYSVKVIQDAAHAFGAQWDGRSISEWTDFTCYSFQAIKHFTTGDGGALVARDIADFELAKKLKWFGFDRDKLKDEKGDWKGQKWDADIELNEVGFKFNMNNVSAAIGLANLNTVQGTLSKHRENASIYSSIFENFGDIMPLVVPKKATSSYWVFTILVNATESRRDWILEELNKEGIGAGLVHLPNHNYSCFQNSYTQLKETEIFSKTQISLPCGWWLEKADIEFIASTLIKLVLMSK